MQIRERPSARITLVNLKRLHDLALDERKNFFLANPYLKRHYSNSLIAIALCQGAALHFAYGKTGIKDFDVYFFFGRYDRKLINRRPKSVDSGFVQFGVHPADHNKGYEGRRVDFLRRSIDDDIVKLKKGDPEGCIIEYLTRHRTKTARELVQKPVVGLWPKTILGKVIWLPRGLRRRRP